MAARKPVTASGRVFRMSEDHRVKIANSNILNALIEHAEGKREMSASQVQAGLGLVKKILPDLSSVDQTTTLEAGESFSQLLKSLDGSGRRIPTRA